MRGNYVFVTLIAQYFVCLKLLSGQTVKNTFEKLDFWEPEKKQERRSNLVLSKAGHEKFHHDESRSLKHLKLRTQDPVDEQWPKVFKQPSLQQHRRSTRFLPVPLMQQLNTNGTVQQFAENEGDEKRPATFHAYSYEEHMRDLIKNLKNVNVTMDVIGKTIEYNDILMLKMSQIKSESFFRAQEDKYMEEVPQKKIVFIVHGLTTMGFEAVAQLNEIKYFNILLGYYIANLDKFDIFLVPLANPDGVEVAAMWNKNLSPQFACSGVALDRNFDVAWNSTHMINSCSQDYPGSLAFSELESRAIRDVFHKYSHKIVAYFHVHAGTYTDEVFKGEAVLYPKGYTEVASDDDRYIDLKGEIDEAMKNASFQIMSVTVDTLYNWYGKVSGSSVDYASSIYGIPYSMELVMQPYTIDRFESNDERQVWYAVLVEVWKRVIPVIFQNIFKSTNTTNTDTRRFD